MKLKLKYASLKIIFFLLSTPFIVKYTNIENISICLTTIKVAKIITRLLIKVTVVMISMITKITRIATTHQLKWLSNYKQKAMKKD